RRLHGEPGRDVPRHTIADAPRRPTMPTTLPARQAPPPAIDDLAGFLLVLAQVYVVIAGVLWIGVAIEYHLGAFTGLSLAEPILNLTTAALAPLDSTQFVLLL